MGTVAAVLAFLALCDSDPRAILADVDAAASRAKDGTLDLEIAVSTRESEPLRRTLRVWQLGSEKRLVKFLAPARLRGIGILVPGRGQTYLYQPSTNKIRRIAGKSGGGSFEGMGFSINDLARVKFSGDYEPALLSEGADVVVLSLTPKEPGDHEHSALRLTVRRKDNLVHRIETLDGQGKVVRTIVFDDFRAAGAYFVAHRIQVDEPATGKRTVATVSSARFDSGLGDGDFTERHLRRIE